MSDIPNIRSVVHYGIPSSLMSKLHQGETVKVVVTREITMLYNIYRRAWRYT